MKGWKIIADMNIFRFPRRVIGRIKKAAFIREFRYCDFSSGFGTNGVGKDCTVIGKKNMTIGGECSFGAGTELITLDSHFSQRLIPNLVIGNHVRMTARCRITCAGNMTIGDDVLLAPEVFITDHNHGMDPTKQGGYSPQPLIVKDVSIGEGVWLGQRVMILPGVSVGEHSIIGAGSVVTHDIPAYSIAVGSPANVVKKWNFEKGIWENNVK